MSASPTNTTDPSSATATCINVTPDSNGYVPEWACNANYNYDPSFPTAILFTILFGLTLGAHIYQAILYKKIRLCWVVIMGAAWEFSSFAIRSAGAKNQQSNAFCHSPRRSSSCWLLSGSMPSTTWFSGA